jgi:hypothetical protein
MRTKTIRAILGVGLAFSMLSALVVSAGLPPVASPVAVTSDEGLFAITLPAGQPTALGLRARGKQRAEQGTEALLKSLVTGQIQAAIGRGELRGKAKRLANTALTLVLQKLREQIVGVGSSSVGTQAVGDGNLNVLATAAGVTVVGLQSDEELTVGYSVGGTTYSAALDQQRLVSGSGGVTLQIDYSTPPSRDNLDGSLFAALIRDTEAGGIGVLVVVVLDSSLPDVLSPLGAVNADAAGTPITIPYSITLTGSETGEHHSVAPSFDDLYYAKQGVVGLAVPEALSEAAQKLLSKVR